MLLSPMEANQLGISNEERIRRNTIAILLWIKKQNCRDFHVTNFPVNFNGLHEVEFTNPGLFNTQEISHHRFMAQLTELGEEFLKTHEVEVQQVLEMLPHLKQQI